MVCFGPSNRAVQPRQVSELEFEFINCGPILLLAMCKVAKKEYQTINIDMM